MRILLDNGTPRGVMRGLLEHNVEECRSRGWDRLGNGELLDAAEEAGFDVFLMTDKNLRYQQNLAGRRISIVVLSNGRWKLIRLRLSNVVAAVENSRPGAFTDVEILES